MGWSQDAAKPAEHAGSSMGFDVGRETAFLGTPAAALVFRGATAGEPPDRLSVPDAAPAFRGGPDQRAAPESCRPT